jgi:hypothetical protein
MRSKRAKSQRAQLQPEHKQSGKDSREADKTDPEWFETAVVNSVAWYANPMTPAAK